MAGKSLPDPTVGEAARKLIHAADTLTTLRENVDKTAAVLEARWASNRRRLGIQGVQVAAPADDA